MQILWRRPGNQIQGGTDSVLWGRSPGATVTTEPDLLAAIIAHLRATPTIVSAFGEDESSPATTKFHADVAPTKVELPWAVYEENEEDRTPVSVDSEGITNYFCRGRVNFAIVADGKRECRTLADLLIATLTDAELVFDDGILLELRSSGSRANTLRDIVPGTPIAHQRLVSFLYMVQRV